MPVSLPAWLVSMIIAALEKFITPDLINQMKAALLQWLQDEATKLGSPLAAEAIAVLEKVLGLAP